VPHPRRVRFAGLTYSSIGWALGDVLRVEPRASDQLVAAMLDVTPQSVAYWRRKAGIPEFRKRSPNPYLEKKTTTP